MAEITKDDRQILQCLTKAIRDLNEFVESLHETPYEVGLRLEKTKQGYPRVRHELRRKIG